MKSPVAVALIVCGALLVCAPPLSDHMTTSQMLIAQQTIAASERPMPGINLPTMSTEYRFGCFVLGAAMIIIAVIGSSVARKAPCQVAAAVPAERP
jgi:hypothetical protein